MIFIEQLAPVVPTGARTGKKLTGFLGVTVHETGNTDPTADARRHANLVCGAWSTKQNSSSHYYVDEEYVYRVIPEDEMSINSGTLTGNYKTVSIEVCVNKTGQARKDAWFNAAWVAADCLIRHGIFKAVPKKTLFQHYDWNRKDCPAQLRAGNPYPYRTFVDTVNWFIGEILPKGDKIYTVQPLLAATLDRAKKAAELMKAAGLDSRISAVK